MLNFYQRLLEFTRDGVYRYTFDEGRILLANQGFVDLLDLDISPKEMVGKFVREVMVYTEPEGTIRRMLADHREIHDYEYHFKTLKGEDRWVVHDSFVATDPDTGQKVVDAFVKDVTQRKLTEARLRRQRNFVSAIVDTAGALVVVLDRYGRVVRFNHACEEITGYGFLEVRGQPMFDLFVLPEERDEVMAIFERLRAGDFPVHHENYWRTKDGRKRLISWSNTALVREAGEVDYIIATGLDVTEHRAAEHALQQAHDQLELRVEERTAELLEANERLREEVLVRQRAEERIARQAEELVRSNAELESFANVASHDLQEPLRKIRAFGDRLVAVGGETLTEEAQEYVARMQDAAGRMSGLITDLLQYARVTTKAQPFAEVSLGKIASEVVSDLEVAIEEAGVKVEVGELPELEAEPLQMRQLLQNLIGNALKFRREDVAPVVRVWGEPVNGLVEEAELPELGEDAWRIFVEDNGIGFEPKYIERIFGVFQRLHSRHEYPGTGIGLAICRKIAERHHGGITAHSTPQQGSTFIVTLPSHQPKGATNQ